MRARFVTVAVLALTSAHAFAQGAPPRPDGAAKPDGVSPKQDGGPAPDPLEAWFDKLANSELSALALPADAKEKVERSHDRIHDVAVETPALDAASGFTAAERAAAMVSTSVEGAQAGVVLAPFALAGPRDLRGINVTIAALDDGVTRVGTGYVYQSRSAPSLEDLELTCKRDDAKAANVLKSVRPLFVKVCREVVNHIDPADLKCDALKTADEQQACRIEVNGGMAACGYAPPFKPPLAPLKAPPQTVTAAIASIEALTGYARAQNLPLVIANDAILTALTGFHLERPLDCLSADTIEDAVAKWAWTEPTYKISIAGFLDMFPLTLGHNPEMLKRFEAKSRELRLDFAFTKGGWEVGAGLGLASSREERGGALTSMVRPSFRISWAVGALDGERLRPRGDPSVRTNGKGKLPPMVILGVRGDLGVAPSPPDTDDAKLRDLTLTLHADFRYSADLAFRIGVPLQMKRVAAKADPTDIGAQWTLPVFVATVLSL